MIVVASRDLKIVTSVGNHQDDDPRALGRLRRGDDQQHDAGDDRAEAVDRRAGPPARRAQRPPVETMPACDSVNETKTPIM